MHRLPLRAPWPEEQSWLKRKRFSFCTLPRNHVGLIRVYVSHPLSYIYREMIFFIEIDLKISISWGMLARPFYFGAFFCRRAVQLAPSFGA